MTRQKASCRLLIHGRVKEFAENAGASKKVAFRSEQSPRKLHCQTLQFCNNRHPVELANTNQRRFKMNIKLFTFTAFCVSAAFLTTAESVRAQVAAAESV